MSQQPPNQLLTLPGLGGGGTPNNVSPTPLPWWRRPRVIIGIAIALLILIVGGLLLSILNRKPPATYQEQQVMQGDLSLTVNATGPLQSSIYNLVFQGTGGKIVELDVKQGQKVTKGQVLARLDKTALQDAVNSAQSNLDSARLSLNSALSNAGASANQVNASINAAQTSVNVAQNNQNAAGGVSNASVASAQTTLDNAQRNLDSVRTTVDAQKSQAETQREQDLRNCETNPSASTSSSGAPTGNVPTTASSSMADVLMPFSNLLVTANAKSTPSPAPAPTPMNASGTTNAPTTSSSTTPATQAPVPTPTPDPAKVATCKQLAEDRYNSTIATADANVTTAENQVNTAQIGLTQAQATGNQTNTTSQGQVTTSQSSVDTAKANPAAVTAQGQISTAQGQLGVAVANLATAQHNLDNATLTAPHDGTVTTVNGTVGGQPGVPTNGGSSGGSSSGTFIQIVDLNSLQVQANVNESDTANLKVGQPVAFTVNAYGNRQFNGTVSGISPNGVTVSNVVTYPVNIDVDLKSANGANLLPNMTANATITVVQRKNVPQISVNAVNFARLASSGSTGTNAPQLITRKDANAALNKARQMLGDLENQNSSVAASSPIPAFVIQRPGGGDVFTARSVVLGLTDGTNYEVLEGLQPGESYIIGSGNTTRTGTGG
ncbi:MAG: hypothetical protein PVSMB5_31610 [Ktedonobacteraceae bacterium]